MNVDELLSRLDGVKQKRAGQKWMACCPAHKDKTPSLAITIGNNGCILLKDFGGCDLNAILRALGISLWELDPNARPPSEHAQRSGAQRRENRDAVKVIAHEALVVAIAAETIAGGKPLANDDIQRLRDAAVVLRQAAMRV